MVRLIEDINPNKIYYTDKINIYESVEDYFKDIEDCYEGIKDDLESWLNSKAEENLEEKTGREILEELLVNTKEVVKKLERKLENGRS